MQIFAFHFYMYMVLGANKMRNQLAAEIFVPKVGD